MIMCGNGEAIVPAGITADQRLAQLNISIARTGHYSVCTETGSGISRGTAYECLSIRLEQEIHQTRTQEKALIAQNEERVRASFAALQTAWHILEPAYIKSVEQGCGGGNGCGVTSKAAELALRRQWRRDLAALDGEGPPAEVTHALPLLEQNAALNQEFLGRISQVKEMEACKDCGDSWAKTEAAERASERAWIKYREAWVTYGAQRWPQTSPDQWRSWQTSEWLPTLRGDASPSM
jgi:hypothetical protein